MNRPPAHLSRTAGLSDEQQAKAGHVPAVPFSPDAIPVVVARPPPETPAVTQAPHHLGSTAGLSFGEHRAAGRKAATPFEWESDAPLDGPTAGALPLPEPEPEPRPPAEPLPSSGGPVACPPRRTPAIPVFNRTPFTLVNFPWQVRPPQETRTVFVKGTFDLVPGAPARPRKESDLPGGDVHHGGAAEQSLAYSSDFALFKPRADVTLQGSAHGGAMGIAQASFAFGHAGNRFERRLAVFGERRWRGGSMGIAEPGAPEPFESMPLVYERAFGGARFDDNPLGVGHAPGEAALGRLPNLEDPTHLITSPRDTPPPACFAPLRADWKERRSKLGTYDAAWLKTRWPYFPEDFEWTYFQAAPRAQQLAYLTGDEPYEIAGMHAAHPTLRGTLPGLRLRCALQETAAARRPGARGDDAARHGGVRRGGDEAHPRLARRARGERRRRAGDRGPPAHLGADGAGPRDAGAGARRVPGHDANRARGRARAGASRQRRGARGRPGGREVPRGGRRAPRGRARDARQGGDRHARSPGPPARTAGGVAAAARRGGDRRQAPRRGRGGEGRRAAHRGAERRERRAGEGGRSPRSRPSPFATVRDRVVAMLLESGASFEGMDLSPARISPGLPTSARRQPGARQPQGRALAGNATSRRPISRSRSSAARRSARRRWRGPTSPARICTGPTSRAPSSRTRPSRARASPRPRARARASAARREPRRCSRTARGRARASTKRTVLPSADFSRARRLDGASFAGATLAQVRLFDAKGIGTRFDGAKILEARGDEVSFTEASFQGADASRSTWEKAVLDASSFRGAKLSQASFVRASCNRAIFSAAEMAEARFSRARLVDAQLVKTNLMKAALDRADLTRADLRGANLHGAETWKAKLDGAQLELAIVTGSKL